MDESPVSDSSPSSDEARTLARVVATLRQRYPGHDADDITERVRQAHRRYAGARVREFVPVLVERDVTRDLRTVPPP